MSADPTGAAPRPTGGPGVTRFATRGGHRLSYESSGVADGISILGLHDLLADRGQLRPLADALPRHRFRLTLPDARGHGAAPMVSGRAYPAGELVADALAVLDAEGLARVHVAAVGWGAGTALGLALAAPGRVASLVLAAPFLPTLAGRSEPLETLRKAADAAEKGQTDLALDLYFGMRRGAEWRDGMPKVRLGAVRRAAGSLGPLLAEMASAPLSGAGLNRLDIPLTILVAEDAPAVERQTADALAAIVPRSRLKTLPLASDVHPTFDEEWAAALTQGLVAGS